MTKTTNTSNPTTVTRKFLHEVEQLFTEVTITWDAEKERLDYKVNGVTLPLKFRSLRGAQREATGNMIDWGYRPVGEWHINNSKG